MGKDICPGFEFLDLKLAESPWYRKRCAEIEHSGGAWRRDCHGLRTRAPNAVSKDGAPSAGTFLFLFLRRTRAHGRPGQSDETHRSFLAQQSVTSRSSAPPNHAGRKGSSVVSTRSALGLESDQLHGRAGQPLHRISGPLAQALSIPQWPLMLIFKLISRPSRPFRRLRLGNKPDRADGIQRRKCFVTFGGATPVPRLKWLPLLFAMVSGNLRMVI
jgi:hypothetical protein